MKKKVIGILVCLMLMAMTPAAAGVNFNTETTETKLIYDNGPESTEGGVWEFTKIGQDELSVEITQPEENFFYLRNMQLLPLDNRTVIYGPIDIKASVSSTAEIEKVEFYIDGKIKHTDEEAPYEYHWAPIISSFKHIIKVIAYDTEGNSTSDELEVFKWRLHPLLSMAGVAVVLTLNIKLLKALSGYTVLRGLVFNLKQRGNTLTFRAIRLHYTTVKLRSTESGAIKLKKCTITGGSNMQFRMGPLDSPFSWFFCVCRAPSFRATNILSKLVTLQR